jgi:hypothetical protein
MRLFKNKSRRWNTTGKPQGQPHLISQSWSRLENPTCRQLLYSDNGVSPARASLNLNQFAWQFRGPFNLNVWVRIPPYSHSLYHRSEVYYSSSQSFLYVIDSKFNMAIRSCQVRSWWVRLSNDITPSWENRGNSLMGFRKLTHLEIFSINISHTIRLVQFITQENFYNPPKMELVNIWV